MAGFLDSNANRETLADGGLIGISIAMVTISRVEGFRTLWRGVSSVVVRTGAFLLPMAGPGGLLRTISMGQRGLPR